jgi:hypothetical protein
VGDGVWIGADDALPSCGGEPGKRDGISALPVTPPDCGGKPGRRGGRSCVPATDTRSGGPFLDDFSYVPDRVSAADTSTIGGPDAELSD